MEFTLKLINEQIMSYPELETQDIYKLLHQSIFGAHHLNHNKLILKKCLLRELERCSLPTKDEKAYELLNTNPLILRLNLRPFKSANGNFLTLLEKLEYSVNKEIGSEELFKTTICTAIKYLELNANETLATNLKRLIEGTVSFRNFVFHHSDKYKKLYCPSYRVLIFENMLLLENFLSFT